MGNDNERARLTALFYEDGTAFERLESLESLGAVGARWSPKTLETIRLFTVFLNPGGEAPRVLLALLL